MLLLLSGRFVKVMRIVFPICFFMLLSFFPARMLYKAYVPEGFFTRLIYFNNENPARLLPEAQALPEACKTPNDYDGQFYAQIALVLNLDRDILDQVIDNPAYRARRIGMPALANGLSFGHKDWVIPIYSILPVVFWFVLLGYLMLRKVALSWKYYAFIVSIMLSSGTLISLDRALPDFPASVLAFFALDFVGLGFWSAGVLALAVLFKETTILHCLIFLPTQHILEKNKWLGFAIKSSIVVLPIIFWIFYINLKLDSGYSAGRDNFSLPGVSVFNGLQNNAIMIFNLNWKTMGLILDYFAIFSITFQALYFLINVKITDLHWRFGIGFSLLWFVLGNAVLEDIHAFSRVILPLTIAFNYLILHNSEGKKPQYFIIWWLIGNIGLMGYVVQILVDFI